MLEGSERREVSATTTEVNRKMLTYAHVCSHMQDKLEEVSEKTMEVNKKKEVSLEEISKTVEQVLKYLILGTEISALARSR